ncbi:GlxA family transcriptional regulator [Piscinibacter defluvii]|uniref:GlxA family transcriptional regulator n=1 Tax=Piscinibacter defluvii TaxID=1796922 RepID=UPI000FDE5DD0|nr:GlxA family transcriptional regulator [Piscinibacter defluvii]
MAKKNRSKDLRRPAAELQRYGLLLVPNFSLIALAAVVDPLRLANGVLGRKAYEYVTLGVALEPIASSDGIRVLPDLPIADSGPLDAVFVIGPNPIPKRGFGEVSNWLRRQEARGVALGGVDTGSFYLARAGLLDGYRCTIHWEDRDALLEHFPQLIVTNHLVEIDRDRFTCSGGVSPLDLMTLLLSRPPGSRELAAQVSDLLVSQQRSPDERQHVPLRQQFGHVPGPLIDALEMMESNVEEPLKPDEIAGYLGISRRTLERLFLRQLGMSPAQKYLEIRLERARLAMLRSSRGLDEVAQSVGFTSPSHFIARYRRAFGKTPAADRAARQPA